MRGRGARQDRAFTLIELLVAVAVIALLVGILLPSLAGARGAGQMAVCGSNLRQLAVANELYAGDHDERYAPGAADELVNLNRWHGSRATPSQAFTPEGGALTAYIGGSDGPLEAGTPGAPVRRLGVRVCPTFVPTLAALDGQPMDAGFERACGGYGYNKAFVGTDRSRAGEADEDEGLWTVRTDRVGADRARFFMPSKTIAFADAAIAVDTARGPAAVEYSFIEPRFWPDQTRDDASRADPSMHFRHGGVASTVHLDGHVSNERMAFTWWSGIYAADPKAFSIGWPGEIDGNDLFDYE